jgi:hypothetical protein
MPGHHPASLSIAAYGFLMPERLIADKPVGDKKNFIERQVPALPKDYVSRGSPARATARGSFDHDPTAPPQVHTDRPPRTLPLLRQGKRKRGNRLRKGRPCDPDVRKEYTILASNRR